MSLFSMNHCKQHGINNCHSCSQDSILQEHARMSQLNERIREITKKPPTKKQTVDVKVYALVDLKDGYISKLERTSFAFDEVTDDHKLVELTGSYEKDVPEEVVEISESMFDRLWNEYITSNASFSKDQVRKFLGFKGEK